MSTAVEQIKERLRITDVIGSYITLENSGVNFKAKCPFHNEKTPSFFVSAERNTYYCFGCGAKGDIFSFVEEFEGLDFKGALKVLAERAGVSLTTFKKENQGEQTEEEILFDAMEAATNFFQENLKATKDSLIYLKNRGLSIDMVRSWRIGFAQDEWRSLKDYLLSRGFSEAVLLKAGLIKQGDKGSYDRFRARIMFPIFDGSGRVIAFSGRAIRESEHEPKYLNSPETPLFEKSKVLYGFQKAKYVIKEKRFAILVEGQMDLLMSHQVGFANTVASSGTSLTPDHINIIRRLTDSLVIAYDSDNAGINASFKAWQMALSAGLSVKVASLKAGSDPADAIKENPSLWKDAVEQARHIIDYFLAIAKTKSESESDTLMKETILPLVRSLESSIDQSRYIRTIAHETGIAEKALWEDLAKVSIEVTEELPFAVPKGSSADPSRKAISLLLYYGKKMPDRSSTFRKKLEEILPDFSERMSAHEAHAEALIFEAEAHYGNSPNGSPPEDEILRRLEEDTLKDRFGKAMIALRKAEESKDKDKVDTIAKDLDDISKKLAILPKKYQALQ